MMIRLLLICLLPLLTIAEASAAVKLRNYESRIRRAVEQIERIKADPSEYGKQGMETIVTLIPRTEEVEIEGQAKPFPVDNIRLYSMLNEYQAEDDPQRRVRKLNEIGGMLSALGDHLLRIEEASTAKAETADSRAKIRQILDRPDYQARKESRLGAFLRKIWEAVSNFLSELYAAFVRMLGRLFGASAGASWLSMVVIMAALSAAFIGVMRLALRMKPLKRRPKKRTVLGEEMEEGTNPRELAEAAMAAARAGDFRTGMRKLYLSLLYDLADRHLIELEENATNHEYLSRVSRFSSLAPAMRYLTDRFDHFWYGMFPSTEEDFSSYLARYHEALERAESLGEHAA
ncbi:MAG TPA: DUF4129 domain-containing protein [Blastocatellia bacterium]|jgi:hypothetical protein|nr:DUF4129 domain-containing protein [Blastocatellia bacterium]